MTYVATFKSFMQFLKFFLDFDFCFKLMCCLFAVKLKLSTTFFRRDRHRLFSKLDIFFFSLPSPLNTFQSESFFCSTLIEINPNAFAEDSPCSATLWRLNRNSAETTLRLNCQLSRSQSRQSVTEAQLSNC